MSATHIASRKIPIAISATRIAGNKAHLAIITAYIARFTPHIAGDEMLAANSTAVITTHKSPIAKPSAHSAGFKVFLVRIQEKILILHTNQTELKT